MAAIAEIEAMEGPIVPASFPRELEMQEVAHQYMNFSEGEESAEEIYAFLRFDSAFRRRQPLFG